MSPQKPGRAHERAAAPDPLVRREPPRGGGRALGDAERARPGDGAAAHVAGGRERGPAAHDADRGRSRAGRLRGEAFERAVGPLAPAARLGGAPAAQRREAGADRGRVARLDGDVSARPGGPPRGHRGRHDGPAGDHDPGQPHRAAGDQHPAQVAARSDRLPLRDRREGEARGDRDPPRPAARAPQRQDRRLHQARPRHRDPRHARGRARGADPHAPLPRAPRGRYRGRAPGRRAARPAGVRGAGGGVRGVPAHGRRGRVGGGALASGDRDSQALAVADREPGDGVLGRGGGRVCSRARSRG